jgi:hypothetical protein
MFIILLAGGVSQAAFSAVRSLPADLRAALRDASAFQMRAAVSAVRGSVRLSFAKAAREEIFSMAEPGAEWQATDVVDKPGAPRRRLGKVAISKSFCILFYEHGGRGRHDHVAVFRLVQDDVKLVWGGVSFQAIVDPAGLLSAIDKGQVADELKEF